MKKRFIFITIIIFIIIFSCKKSSAESNDENTELPKDPLNTIISEMGGRIPKQQIEMVDAEMLDLNDNLVKLSDYKGKVIFLNLWATWCPPCRKEMPSMEDIYKEYKDKDFVILAVSQGEDQSTVKEFLKDKKYIFPIFTDPRGQVSGQYGTGSIPTTYIVNKKGYIAGLFVGGRDWHSKEAVELFKILINKK